MKPVSAKTESRLISAFARLLNGDGPLTVANLAREAGVSRATANRATAVLAELRHAVMLQAVPSAPVGQSDERLRRANENILAQHVQVRALSRGEEQRRVAGGKVIPIIRR